MVRFIFTFKWAEAYSLFLQPVILPVSLSKNNALILLVEQVWQIELFIISM
jgi:hypothetical protein